jgi:hypothetical protein
MTICVRVGSVTTAVPLLGTVTNSVLRLFQPSVFQPGVFQLGQHFIEQIEPLLPRLLIPFHPVVDRLERSPVDPVQTYAHAESVCALSEIDTGSGRIDKL